LSAWTTEPDAGAGADTVAAKADRPYVRVMPGHDIPAGMPARVSGPRLLVPIAAALGVLLASTILLWAHYGGAVFYEMIAAGIALCF
jgi:hypothetical protein